MKTYTVGPRLHPQSWEQLRQLVRLHGADPIIRAALAIKREQRDVQAVSDYIRDAERRHEKRIADRIDGYDRDDLGESPDY